MFPTTGPKVENPSLMLRLPQAKQHVWKNSCLRCWATRRMLA